MKLKLILILFSFASMYVYSQKVPIKFGKIDKADLEMTVYEKDSSAPAVILCDYGYFWAKQFQFVRVLRIKILKKEGYSWADNVFPTSTKADIRGITYNLVNGEIVEERLKAASIFEEKVAEDYYRMRVAMPNVKVGSVIDIEFTYIGLPMEWRFQEIIPVVWSELIIEYSRYVNFQKNFFGYEPLYIRTDGRWVGKDMPAFKAEPFMNAVNNYITKFEIDILEFNFPFYHQSITTTWGSVNSYLNTSKYFGDAITGSTSLTNMAKDIEGMNLSDEKKLEAAFNAIKKAKWDESQSLYTSSPNISSVLKNGVGNSADINLLLLDLLKKLNIKAYPVVLSTRNNGVLSPTFPSLHKLNHVIVLANMNKKQYLLDATEEYLPYNILPPRCLNWQGRLVDQDSSRWVELKALKKDRELISYNLQLQEDLSCTGDITFARYDYAAYNFRKKYHSFNSVDEYLNDFRKDRPGLKIIQPAFENTDSLQYPVKDKYEVQINGQLYQIGGDVYLYPVFYEQMKENLFKSDERKYPVDFTYPIEKTISINIRIPDNMQVVEIPGTANLKMPENAAGFLYQVSNMNNQLNINLKFMINKEIFLTGEYPDLKEFFNQIIKKQAEPIILKVK